MNAYELARLSIMNEDEAQVFLIGLKGLLYGVWR
jgi:hypothetical protein